MKLSETKFNPSIKSPIKIFIIASTLALSGCVSMTGWLNQPRNSAPAQVKVIPQKISQYTVQTGDTLYSIAKKFNRTERAIILWNNMSEPYTVYTGETIKLYPANENEGQVTQSFSDAGSEEFNDQLDSQSTQTKPQAPQFIVTHNDMQKDKPSDVSGVQKSNILGDQKTQIYVVQSGDTVLGVAYQHGMSLAQIAAKNDLKPPYNIFVGQQLRVLTKPKAPVEVTKLEPKKKEVPAVVSKPKSNAEPRPVAPKPKSTQKSTPIVNTVAAKQPIPKTDPDKVNAAQPSKNWAKPLHQQMTNEGVGANGSTLYAASSGAPVYAAAKGAVLYAGIGTQGYGEMVILSHSDGYLSAYSNLNGIDVKEGQAVATGEKVGLVGKFRGKSDLGFEIRKDGTLISQKGLW
jgi:murein DD-endopeptidase MepM/ murein hydrolase activator NlpD